MRKKTPEKVSRNVKETSKIAHDFLNKILKNNNKGALVVGLSGELGAGKTAFTQAVAKHLGIKKKVNSPTFVIMKKYSLKTGRYKFLFHLDAYRLKNAKELFYLGWEEIISNKEYLIFIEWPERVSKAMPKKYHKIHISHVVGGSRKFQIS